MIMRHGLDYFAGVGIFLAGIPLGLCFIPKRADLSECLKVFPTAGQSAIPYAWVAAVLAMTESAAQVAVSRLRCATGLWSALRSRRLFQSRASSGRNCGHC